MPLPKTGKDPPPSKTPPPKTGKGPPPPKMGKDLPPPKMGKDPPPPKMPPPIVISSSPVKDDGSTWVRDPYLHVNDKAVIESNAWLNCRLIDASQQLLKNTFHLPLSGLQSPQNGKGYQFKTVSGHFVQIHAWVTLDYSVKHQL